MIGVRISWLMLARKRLLARFAASAAGFVIAVSLTAAYAYTRLPGAIDPPHLLESAAGEIVLPTAGLDDGHLHRFGVDVDGAVVRFFVLKPAGGKLVTSFDACEVCGGSGYVEDRGRLVCIACAADIVPATVGIGGGCNPIPLHSRLEDGALRIAVPDLRAQAATFREAAEAGSTPPPTR